MLWGKSAASMLGRALIGREVIKVDESTVRAGEKTIRTSKTF